MKTRGKKQGIKNLSTSLSINPEHMLRKFSTTFKEEKVLINWSIISFTENNLYWIERSSDGIDYDIIGLREGSIKSNGEEILFSFVDHSPSDKYSFYRIKYGERTDPKKVLFMETQEGMYFAENALVEN
jgi:hypothetical protein